MNWLDKFNIFGMIIIVLFIILSFWWAYGVPAFVITGCLWGLINYFVNDYRRDKRLRELEDKLVDEQSSGDTK